MKPLSRVQINFNIKYFNAKKFWKPSKLLTTKCLNKIALRYLIDNFDISFEKFR